MQCAVLLLLCQFVIASMATCDVTLSASDIEFAYTGFAVNAPPIECAHMATGWSIELNTEVRL
jgi:hypothetical protein